MGNDFFATAVIISLPVILYGSVGFPSTITRANVTNDLT